MLLIISKMLFELKLLDALFQFSRSEIVDFVRFLDKLSEMWKQTFALIKKIIH